MQSTGPIYLSCIQNPSSQVWYKKQPKGVNKIIDTMKSIVKGSSLENYTKTFTNHSARKTVAKKLKTAGLERSSIVKVKGHRNEKSNILKRTSCVSPYSYDFNKLHRPFDLNGPLQCRNEKSPDDFDESDEIEQRQQLSHAISSGTNNPSRQNS